MASRVEGAAVGVGGVAHALAEREVDVVLAGNEHRRVVRRLVGVVLGGKGEGEGVVARLITSVDLTTVLGLAVGVDKLDLGLAGAGLVEDLDEGVASEGGADVARVGSNGERGDLDALALAVVDGAEEDELAVPEKLENESNLPQGQITQTR